MNTDTAPAQVVPYDAARFLDNEERICAYLTEVLQQDDPDLLLLALGDIARARGISHMAKVAGVGRESLYKTLTPGARPRYDTIFKLLRATGLRLAVQPLEAAA